MVCLGFEPGTAEWWSQTNPLCIGGLHTKSLLFTSWLLFLLVKWTEIVFVALDRRKRIVFVIVPWLLEYRNVGRYHEVKWWLDFVGLFILPRCLCFYVVVDVDVVDVFIVSSWHCSPQTLLNTVLLMVNIDVLFNTKVVKFCVVNVKGCCVVRRKRC